MGLADIAAQVNADYANEVKINTWGHLAPEKGKTYPIQMTAAVGYFNDDTLNPILLTCGPEDGPWYGPWFYDSVREFLSDRLGKDQNSGKLFAFTGHWRNYRFVGKFKKIKL